MIDKVKNKKMLFLLIMMSAIIGCGNTDKIDAKESVCVHENTSIALDIPDEYKNLDIYEEKEEMHEQNANAHISDDKTSNIEFNMEEIISTPLTDYGWLDVNKEDYDYYEIYQWIGYAIKEYNNNNIVGVYRCNIPDDIVDEETTMVFTVRVHSSEAVDLNIWLDLYNNKIIVMEA